MATPVILPKVGNTVEACIITAWKKAVGEEVQVGEVIAEVETDKAIMEIESTESGLLLATLYEVGDLVPVMENIAVVGEAGESVAEFASAASDKSAVPVQGNTVPAQADATHEQTIPMPHALVSPTARNGKHVASPRARKLAQTQNIPLDQIVGTGPDGRIIERDLLAYQAQSTPLARAVAAENGTPLPANGSGIGGRVRAGDVDRQPPPPPTLPEEAHDGEPLKGVRKIVADRMRGSLQEMAQLTLHASADARALKAYRKRLKGSPPDLGLTGVSINHLILFAVARTLPVFPGVNATLDQGLYRKYTNVNLGYAVDTPRGLMVPVIQNADQLSLKALAETATDLAEAAIAGKISPDYLQGGTFTVTNLGSFGIEQFTPIINPPQVAILGVGNINLKAVEVDEEVLHIPHVGLSLTIDHQVVDGAPGARFMQALIANISQLDLLTAL